MKLHNFVICLLFGVILADDALEDVQTEFYLPYSATEDVDFSLSKPSGFGCYQWSTDEEEVVALQPILIDYDNMCGSRLEFKIIKNNGKPNIDFKITAENVDMSSGYDNPDVPMLVEFTIHVRPLAKLEVLGLKTELTAGSDPVPFGVAGYDAEENEFDTLDGLQITWYIGSKREIADFENFRTMGPIVKVKPIGTGAGAVIAIVTDKNYEKVQPAFMEFSVKANLLIEPDGAFLLEGATAKLQLFEQSGILDKEGNPTKVEIETTGKEPDFTFDIKEPEYVTLDPTTNVMTAVQQGETTVFVKNSEGEIVKGMPIRVDKANKIKIVAEPSSKSNQLIKGNDYTIKINIFTKEDRPIYPSENILCKTTFPRNLEVKEISENGLEAKVTAKANGLGKVKANLRSVLDSEDEELEIIPHIKGSTDFEIYDQVVIKPTFTVLPWDDNVKPNYTLTYKAEGGGQTYTWTSDLSEAVTLGKMKPGPKEAMVSNDNAGVFHTTASGAVSFKVRATTANSETNFDEAQVHILPATHIELDSNSEEFSTTGIFRGNVKFYTLMPKTNEKVMFTDCSNIPYEVKLSDPENFYVEDRSRQGAVGINHCAHFNIKAKKSGLTCKVTVSYLEPSSGRTLRSHLNVASYKALGVVHPYKEKAEYRHTMLLPIGSTGKIIFQGGPQPWPQKQVAHSKHIQVEDGTIAKITEQKIEHDSTTDYIDEHIYDVTCLAEGTTEVAFNIGNSKTGSEHKTAAEEKLVDIECGMPAKLMFKYNHVDEESKIVVNRKTNRVVANKDKDLKLTFTLKDKKGKTFTSVDSLNIETKVSDDSLLTPETTYAINPTIKVSSFGSVSTRPEHVLKVKGSKGDVDVKFKLAGYNEEVLAKAGITNPPALPKVIDDDEDMDYEDEEDFSMHGHALIDELELHLASGEDIEKMP